MKAFIHIGAEKTGTTSVQNFCAANRQLLLQLGMLYPAAVGSPNQTKLTAFCLADRKIDDLRRDQGIFETDQVNAFRIQLRETLAKEVNSARGVNTIVFSNEHLQSRLLTVPEVRRLRELIGHFADDVKIVLYLRRQDNVAVSYYSTRLKAGSTDDDPIFPHLSAGVPLPRYYDYAQMVDLYERVFGLENIILRVYEPRRLVGGDLLEDFRHACGMPENERFVDPRRRNESLSEAGLAFFRRLNETVPRFIDGRPNPIRGEIVGLASRYLVGPGPKVNSAEAARFYAAFRAGNRTIAERYFPTWDGRLFEEDFSNHDVREAQAMDPNELIDLAIQLWIERNRRIDEIELGHALGNFALRARESSNAEPEFPFTHVNVHLPRELLCRYVGALLYAEQFGRAAAEAARIADGMKARGVFILAHGLALSSLGNNTALEKLSAANAEHPRLQKALREFAGKPAGLVARPEWARTFASVEGLPREFYEHCLKWLGP